MTRQPNTDNHTGIAANLARQIREERQRQGLNKSELARKAGTYRQRIARIENGDVTDINELETVMRALGIDGGMVREKQRTYGLTLKCRHCGANITVSQT